MAGRRSRIRITVRRATVAALLLAVLPAAPAMGSPGPGRAELQAKAVALQTRLDQQYAALERISEQVDKALAAEGELRDALARVQASRQIVADQLAAAQKVLDQQVWETYEAGPGWFVSELVGATDPFDLMRRVPMQKAALEASARNLDEVRRQKADLDRLNAAAAAALAEQQRLDAGVLSKRRQIDALTRQLQATLKGIDRRLGGVLEAQQRQAEAARRAAYAAWAGSQGGSGQASWMQAGGAAQAAVAYAMRQLGKPYQWGAAGPGSFDCSGLTSAAYRAAGTAIPRVAADQFNAGTHVGVPDLLPGDLVFYADDPANPATIHHVGIYIGNGLMVHAPHTGDVVRIASIWRDGYAGAVRVVAGGARPGATPPPPPSRGPSPLPPPPMTTAPPATTAPPPAPRTSTTTPPPSSAPGSTSPGTTSSTTSTTEPPTTTAPAESSTSSSSTTTEPPTTTGASPTG